MGVRDMAKTKPIREMATTDRRGIPSVDDENLPLTPLELKFVENFKTNGMVIQKAAFGLYPNDKRVMTGPRSWELYRKPHVKKIIDELIEQKLLEKGFTKENMIEQWLNMIGMNATDLLSWESDENGKIKVTAKSSNELTADQKAGIKNVKMGKDGRVEFEMHDKANALKQLGEIIGLYPSKSLLENGRDGSKTTIQVEIVRNKMLDKMTKLEQLEADESVEIIDVKVTESDGSGEDDV